MYISPPQIQLTIRLCVFLGKNGKAEKESIRKEHKINNYKDSNVKHKAKIWHKPQLEEYFQQGDVSRVSDSVRVFLLMILLGRGLGESRKQKADV